MSHESSSAPEASPATGSADSRNPASPQSLTAALVRLLPVHSLRSLLPELAACWRDAAQAEVGFVSVTLESGTAMRGAVVSARRSPELLAAAIDQSLPWNAAAAHQLLATSAHRDDFPSAGDKDAVGSDSHAGSQWQTIPFALRQECIGGVLLHFAGSPLSHPAIDRELWQEPAELSARLIAQAFLADPATVHDIERLIPDPEKLEAMAEFAAGAGHEINNPVATISGRVQMLLRGETDPERRHALTNIGGQALRIRDMIGDAMLFARPPQPRPVAVALAESLRQVIDKLAAAIHDAEAEVSLQLAPDLPPLLADPDQLAIVLSNLLLNSLEALTGPGSITVSAKRRIVDDREFVRFTITDPGRGFTEIERRHLFDPFFSGRQAGRGLGFGLPKCWRIVSNHGGRIEAESMTGTTSVHVDWPASE